MFKFGKQKSMTINEKLLNNMEEDHISYKDIHVEVDVKEAKKEI